LPARADGACQNLSTDTFFTIGHSTRPFAEFAELLAQSRIEALADVRTVPRSRANPQYEGAALARSLAECSVAYEHIAALGGLRGRQRDVPPETNASWQNASFHNYADYALSAAFEAGLAALRALADARPCAIMCAEAVWWRCHRRIIADYLLSRGAVVRHILGRERVEPARLTEAARTGPRGTLVYPAPDAGSGPLLVSPAR
jgi:uncharacterized protein (DUF488 family)